MYKSASAVNDVNRICFNNVLLAAYTFNGRSLCFTSQHEKYTKMDINIDEENIIASVMKEEKTLYYQ